jgi:endonuclease YncB( thermonuclease family)
MPLIEIPGSFRVLNTSPDGDSVRFYADDRDIFTRAGLAVRLNAGGGAQLRLDGIDALETHYTPPHGHRRWRQPAQLAIGAADALLERLGFHDVQRSDDGTVEAVEPAEARGYILTRFADVYGRPVSMVFAGEPAADREIDRSGVGAVPRVYLHPTGLRRSANYALLAAGLVYPTFYSRLYLDLRQAMAAAATEARERRAGVWEQDATLHGVTARSRDRLEQEVVLLPKLFRRLTEYLSLDESGEIHLDGFGAFLAQHDDRLFTVPEGHATSFDTLIEVRHNHIKLTVPPERLVFQEK